MNNINAIAKSIDYDCFICGQRLEYIDGLRVFECVHVSDFKHELYINIGRYGELDSLELSIKNANTRMMLIYIITDNIPNTYITIYIGAKSKAQFNFDKCLYLDYSFDELKAELKKILLLI